MLINGEKWACETCIKGHRATHCKHTDRELIVIKKKGRPSTQCKRCRELRVIRQLHVKCDCESPDHDNQNPTKKKKENKGISAAALKKKMKLEALRPIAPKQQSDIKPSLSPALLPPLLSPVSLPPLIATPQPIPKITGGCCGSNKKTTATNIVIEPVTQPFSHSNKGSCCASTNTTHITTTDNTSTPHPTIPSIPIPAESVPLPHIQPPSSCCGPPSKNTQGETIRIVTCRCGDDCACIGCDAHPSRAMKEGISDVYIGFGQYNSRRLSISAITNSNTVNEHPSSILSENGNVLCGCGCNKTFAECNDCFQELCQDYL